MAVQQLQVRSKSLQRETLRALETFANIVDERDPSTYRHSLRVAGYVDSLARALRLPFSEIDRLRWAGRLHDLGKVAVDASLLRKRGRLDGAEWAAMRRHPRLSARLLQRFEFVAPQARAVELHHERMDGAGYYGVGGDELPLASHFLIVADSFDAMTTDRPYRPGLSPEAALVEIELNAGTQFHPAVAKAFVAVQRGLDPASVLSAAELREIRGASAPYTLGVAGLADLKERPELLALGGPLEQARGADGPVQAALTSWLVREAESGLQAIVAPGEELGRDGVAVALPLRRENSALIGFLVVTAPRLPPRHIELALLES